MNTNLQLNESQIDMECEGSAIFQVYQFQYMYTKLKK